MTICSFGGLKLSWGGGGGGGGKENDNVTMMLSFPEIVFSFGGGGEGEGSRQINNNAIQLCHGNVICCHMLTGMCSNLPTEIGAGLFPFFFLYNTVMAASNKRVAHIRIKSSEVPPTTAGNGITEAPVLN